VDSGRSRGRKNSKKDGEIVSQGREYEAKIASSRKMGREEAHIELSIFSRSLYNSPHQTWVAVVRAIL
jgi:hypothetical protein